MARVALLGTGLLGSGFAEGMLSRGGTELTVWNRTRAKAEPLSAKGAHVADTPADAVRGAERAHLVLLDDDSVEETIAAFRSALSPGAIIIDHTTNHPVRTGERSRRLAAEGIAYLHAPVFMSPLAARQAQGIMMIAGPTPLFERVKDALGPMTGDVWHLGERPDLAAAYKLFGNAMLLLLAGGLADVFHMADALEVPRAQAFALFDRFRIEPGMLGRGQRIVRGDYEATFHLETARKDARLMLEAADGHPLYLLTALAKRMDEVIAQGMGDMDMAVLAKPGV